MSETIVTRPPSEDELSANYKGIGWPDFSQLSNESIAEMLAVWHQEILDSSPEVVGDDYMRQFLEYVTFTQFRIWRKFGIPDREVTYEELVIRIADYVDQRIQQDPDYGLISKEITEGFSQEQTDCIWAVFDYFIDMRDMFEYFNIDEYSLYSTLGLEESDIIFLVDKGILVKQEDDNRVAIRTYSLAEPYYAFLIRGIVQDQTERSDN